MNHDVRLRGTDPLNRLLRPFTTPLEPVDLVRTFLPDSRPDRLTRIDALPATSDPLVSRPDTPPTLRWGDVVLVAPRDATVLDVLEREGEEPVVGCRRGVCRRCVTPLVSGRVHDRRDQRDLEAGTHVRICVSAPLTDVELEPTTSTDRVPGAAAAGGSR